MIKFPRFNANDTEQIYMVSATREELCKAGYFPVLSAANAEIIWRALKDYPKAGFAGPLP